MSSRGSIPFLVVDDKPPIQRFLRTSLAVHGYRILEAGSARDALDVIARDEPEVVLLDLGLPDQDGREVIRRLRAAGSKVAITVVSSRGDEAGKVEAFELGADDYVIKPPGLAELVARIRTALRHRVQQQGAEVKLSNKEWDILRLLVLRAGQVVTHRMIMQEVWVRRSTCSTRASTCASSARSWRNTPTNPSIS